MKRPAFQFYPADWRNNAKLRRCSEAARGVWMDVLCVLHDSDEYGVCRWPLADLARSAGASLKLVRELVSKDVLKGADAGAAPYVYTPRHAGKDGEPVILVAASSGACWYCSRFVRDEWVRHRRGAATQFAADNQPPKSQPKQTPKGGFGERQGDGSTSSSSSSNKPPKAPKGADEVGFARFWDSWPDGERKTARKQCAAKWRTEGCEAIAESVIAAVDAAKRSATWTKNAGEFVPAPLVWLNQRRWESSATSGQSNFMAGAI